MSACPFDIFPTKRMDFLASKWLFFDIHFLRSIQNKSAFLPKWDLLTALKGIFSFWNWMCRNSRILAFSWLRMGSEKKKHLFFLLFHSSPHHTFTCVYPSFIAHPEGTLAWAIQLFPESSSLALTFFHDFLLILCQTHLKKNKKIKNKWARVVHIQLEPSRREAFTLQISIISVLPPLSQGSAMALSPRGAVAALGAFSQCCWDASDSLCSFCLHPRSLSPSGAAHLQGFPPSPRPLQKNNTRWEKIIRVFYKTRSSFSSQASSNETWSTFSFKQ